MSLQKATEKIEDQPAAAAGNEILSPYQVTSVERAEVPEGGAGERWCQYVLENGVSVISGHRRGTVRQVTEYAKDFAEELNERRKSARYYSASTRRKKPDPTTKPNKRNPA